MSNQTNFEKPKKKIIDFNWNDDLTCFFNNARTLFFDKFYMHLISEQRQYTSEKKYVPLNQASTLRVKFKDFKRYLKFPYLELIKLFNFFLNHKLL